MIQFQNPVIPGFYPDPSVCRDGKEYYLVNSSFEFFPGIPLFHSRDLVHWQQIGHVLTRKSQIMLEKCQTSGGIWAPTIRIHNARFYVSATNYSDRGNFYVWTDNIYGEWSEPIWVNQGGIDPSLFFDSDGCVYFASTLDLPDSQAIGQCQIDIKTGEMQTDTKIIWTGSGGKYPEGPHMYKRGGLYYLLAAEGGTEYGHMVTIARGPSPWGPFESYEGNPVLTHQDTMLHHFQAVGHGDITDTEEGDCWMVFHGIRTSQYMLHHLGRETMLAPVTWNENGWPVVNEGKKIVTQMEVKRLPANDSSVPEDKTAAFSPPALPPIWNYLRNPDMSCYSLTERPGWLKLTGGKQGLDEIGSPAFVGRRQQHFCMSAEVWLECNPKDASQKAGITIFHTNEHHYDLAVTSIGGKRCIVLRKRVADMLTEGSPVILDEGNILLRVESDKLEYRFFAGREKESLIAIGKGRTQLLSTECMPMTFTGCYIGMFAECGCQGWFEGFEYEAFSYTRAKKELY